MKRSKFTDEQILAIVKEGEAGRKVADLCRTHGITEQTYYRWKAKYGGMELSEMQRLKGLEDENRRRTNLPSPRWGLAGQGRLASRKIQNRRHSHYPCSGKGGQVNTSKEFPRGTTHEGASAERLAWANAAELSTGTCDPARGTKIERRSIGSRARVLEAPCPRFGEGRMEK